QAFNEVRRASNDGMSYDNAQRVAAHLRSYLGVEAITDPVQINERLLLFFERNKHSHELVRDAENAFAQLDKILYQSGIADLTTAMPKTEVRDLFARLERLVPRP